MPEFFQSVQVLRPVFGGGGKLIFGAPVSTVSGSIWRTDVKNVSTEGEVFTLTAQGFLAAGTDVQRRDHLLVIAPTSGQRYEVFSVSDGHDQTGSLDHVGVMLREAEPF